MWPTFVQNSLLEPSFPMKPPLKPDICANDSASSRFLR
jgi:hypothetical protein